MDYKQIMLNLIEFCKWVQNSVDDYQCSNWFDEEKSVDWNDGVGDAILHVKESMEELGIYFGELSSDELFDLEEKIRKSNFLKEE